MLFSNVQTSTALLICGPDKGDHIKFPRARSEIKYNTLNDIALSAFIRPKLPAVLKTGPSILSTLNYPGTDFPQFDFKHP